MTCAMPGGMELHFIRSGVVITPYELSLRARSRNYMHGQVVCSRGDGKAIKEGTFEAEPAVLKLGGHDAHRFYVSEDDVEFFFNHDNKARARIDLNDGRKVLERGSVERNYTEVSLERVVDDIINDDREDPNRVIEAVQFTEEEITGDIRITGDELFSFAPFIWDFDNPIQSWLRKKFENLEDNPAEIFSGFEFDGITPLQAMEQVLHEFEYDWWVDTDGTLWIGQDGTFGQVVGTIADNSEIVLRRYDVVESATKTNRVLATSDVPSTVQRDDIGSAVPDDVKTRLKSVAVAHAPNLEGDMEQLETKNVLSQAELKRSTGRYLYKQVMDDINGSISINGMASDNQRALARLTPGDHFFVNDDVQEHCAPGTVTGHFLVKSVNHRLSPAQGWKITVNVSKVIDHDEIEMQSFYYDPTTDTRYDNLEELTYAESEFEVPIGRFQS